MFFLSLAKIELFREHVYLPYVLASTIWSIQFLTILQLLSLATSMPTTETKMGEWNAKEITNVVVITCSGIPLSYMFVFKVISI